LCWLKGKILLLLFSFSFSAISAVFLVVELSNEDLLKSISLPPEFNVELFDLFISKTSTLDDGADFELD